MKIKAKPEDFIVKEITRLKLSDKGKYFYFILKKRNLTTLDAINIICREFGIKKKNIGFSGLKDKRAVTEQYISIFNVDKKTLNVLKNFKTKNIELKYVGRGNAPIEIGSHEKNYFEIKIRSLSRREIRKIEDESNINFIKKYGFANYYGEQRFGSVKHAKEFIAKHLLRGDFESALKEYILSSKKGELKRFIEENWGDWKKILLKIPAKMELEKKIFKKLYMGASFLEAFRTIDKEIRAIFLFAYQSYIWNKCLYYYITENYEYCETDLLRWKIAFYRNIDDSDFEKLRETKIPLIGRKMELGRDEVSNIVRRVLREEGLDGVKLRIKKMTEIFFKSELRDAVAVPEKLNVKIFKNSAKISFIIPRGSYATILLKALFCGI